MRLLKVSLDWATPDDYDLEVYLKQADGTLKDDARGSGGPPGAKEIAFIDDPPAGDYVLRVVNFAAVNPAWTLKAEVVRARTRHRDRRRQGGVEADLPHTAGRSRPRRSTSTAAARERRQSLPLEDRVGRRSARCRRSSARWLPRRDAPPLRAQGEPPGRGHHAISLRGIRWDRVARLSLLMALGLVLLLYVKPATRYFEAWQLSRDTQAEVQDLRTDNAALRARSRELKRSSRVELEARRLGMARPGERVYVVRGLPR